MGCLNRVIGSDGVIEVGVTGGPHLRYRLAGEKTWTDADTAGANCHGPGFIDRAMADVIACYQEGRKCQLDASNALIATEIIFGAYGQPPARPRRLPLLIDDNPLAAMVASGDLARPRRR